MTATVVETGGRLDAILDPASYNKIGGASFAVWGVVHVAVGAIGLGIHVTGGTGRCSSS